MFDNIKKNMEEQRFRSMFVQTLQTFEKSLRNGVGETKVRKIMRKKLDPDAMTGMIVRTIQMASDIRGMAVNRESIETYANLLYAETILMQKVNKATQQDKIPITHHTLIEAIDEVSRGFEKAMNQYLKLKTSDVKDELVITRELRGQREKLKKELERQKNLSGNQLE
ncbi:hypothetical protein JMA_35130 [Jeotgalibacillus malaysiensis]|uniref:Uncharacterized protein n=1 Tax=Jeotgalibacillus malaysiensis TaxID=1508404 RepID=A0A0B5ARG3_9BACL|nr:hypothetical protein [Jeotgalibacillus malaysiensis]AJD92830.1 hypothetical protein JMA_35130 [Jeotgalibacillus malaysiensis]